MLNNNRQFAYVNMQYFDYFQNSDGINANHVFQDIKTTCQFADFPKKLMFSHYQHMAVIFQPVLLYGL